MTENSIFLTDLPSRRSFPDEGSGTFLDHSSSETVPTKSSFNWSRTPQVYFMSWNREARIQVDGRFPRKTWTSRDRRPVLCLYSQIPERPFQTRRDLVKRRLDALYKGVPRSHGAPAPNCSPGILCRRRPSGPDIRSLYSGPIPWTQHDRLMAPPTQIPGSATRAGHRQFTSE